MRAVRFAFGFDVSRLQFSKRSQKHSKSPKPFSKRRKHLARACARIRPVAS